MTRVIECHLLRHLLWSLSGELGLQVLDQSFPFRQSLLTSFERLGRLLAEPLRLQTVQIILNLPAAATLDVDGFAIESVDGGDASNDPGNVARLVDGQACFRPPVLDQARHPRGDVPWTDGVDSDSVGFGEDRPQTPQQP